MAFWNNPNVEPKQKFRFLVKIGSQTLYNVKSIDKPTFTVDTKTYTMLNHKFKFPGIPNWEPISMTLVDMQSGGASSIESQLNKMIQQSGYSIPISNSPLTATEKASMGSKSFKSAFGEGSGASTASGYAGTIDIIQLNSDGLPIDHWKLHGPIIKSISFGDLSYESDDLTEYKIDIEYDFATYAPGEP